MANWIRTLSLQIFVDGNDQGYKQKSYNKEIYISSNH